MDLPLISYYYRSCTEVSFKWCNTLNVNIGPFQVQYFCQEGSLNKINLDFPPQSDFNWFLETYVYKRCHRVSLTTTP